MNKLGAKGLSVDNGKHCFFIVHALIDHFPEETYHFRICSYRVNVVLGIIVERFVRGSLSVVLATYVQGDKCDNNEDTEVLTGVLSKFKIKNNVNCQLTKSTCRVCIITVL